MPSTMNSVFPKQVTFEKDDDSDGYMSDTGVFPPEPVIYEEPDTPRPPVVEINSGINLHQCARNDYLDAAKALLKDEKVQINQVDDEGLTPLHVAARYNRFQIVKLLVEHFAEVDSEDHEGMTPLQYACRIKRRRKKSKRTRAQLLDDPAVAHLDSPGGAVNSSPEHERVRKEDKDASAIDYLIAQGADITHKDDYGLTALHHAALRGDEIGCEQLLTYKTDETPLVKAKDIQRMTPLHIAASQNEADVARQLILAGANIRSLDEELSTPLHEAATVGDTKIARIIFDACKKSVNPETALAAILADQDEDGNTPLMLAVESGRYKFVQQCIQRDASLNTVNKWHMTPLHLAAIKGDVRIVKLLIENNARISALNHEHQTPLHKAALFNNTQCIEVLLDSGAELESKDKDNFTPLLLAACYGHAKSVELLIQRGADVTVEDKNDRTCVFLAAEENKLEALEVLLKYQKVKPLVNDRDENNNGPLHVAASQGHIQIAQCLLNHGADLFCKNDMEQTPIHMAACNGWTSVVREIVRREKNSLSDGDEDSNTALHLASMGGHIKLVETLLNLGAEPEVRNSLLRTPIGCAAAAGHLKCVKLLAGSDAALDPIDKTKLTPLLVAAQNGHAEVVDFLIKNKADVYSVDPEGNNCLDLAVDNEHQEVAMEIIKSKAWKTALRNSTIQRKVTNTPLRKLIRKMPEVATEVFNKCIEITKPDDGSQVDMSHKHQVTFHFEFVDDMYNVEQWKLRSAIKKEKEREKVPATLESTVRSTAETLKSLTGFGGKGPLTPYTKESEIFKKNHPMMIMVESSREELLAHPLVTALMHYKWASFGRIFYYLTFCTYVIFLAFLTGYVAVSTPPFSVGNEDNFDAYPGDSVCEKYHSSGATQNKFAQVAKYFILILAFFNIVKEIFQAYHGRLYYISWDNLLEVVLFVSTVLFTLDFEECQQVTGYRTHWQWNVGAVAIVLAWIELVMFIQKFPQLGIYVVMFRYILYTFFKFFIVFIFFIVAFGLGFYCLIQNQTPYATTYHAIIRTSVMMIGEFDYNDIFHGEDAVHYWLTYVLFCFFVVIMSIIIMNLLVGLAVDDIKGVQEQAALRRIAMKVYLVLDIERISLSFTSRYKKDSNTIYFDTIEEVKAVTRPQEELENKIQKSQIKTLKKVDKVKHGLKSLQTDVARIEDMLEAIMKAQNIKVQNDDEL